MAEQLAAGKGGTYYTPFPVLALASDGKSTFLTAGGGGSGSVKEVPNVVQAHTYDEEHGKLCTIASCNTGKSVVVHLSYCKASGYWLASAKNGTKVLSLDASKNTLTEVCEWETEEEGKAPEQNFAKYSPDATLMVTGGTDGVVQLWKVGKPDAAPALLRKLPKAKEVLDASFSADGTLLAICDNSGDLKILNLEQEDDDKGKMVAFRSSSFLGKLFVKYVNFFMAEDGKPMLILSASGGRGPAIVGIFGVDGTKKAEVTVLKSEPLKSVSLDSSGKLLLVGTMSGAKMVYSIPELRLVKKTKPLHSLPSQAVTFLGDRTAISVSGDRSIHFLNYKAGGDLPLLALAIAANFILLLAYLIFQTTFFDSSGPAKGGEL